MRGHNTPNRLAVPVAHRLGSYRRSLVNSRSDCTAPCAMIVDPSPHHIAMSAVVIHCSCPDAGIAARIAHTLVDERLAACVQSIPAITSTYRWQDDVHVDAEALLLIKTTRARVDALKRRVAELHPYDTPELLVLEVVEGAPDYLAWLDAATVHGER